MGDTARDDYTVGNEHDNGPRQPNFLQKRMRKYMSPRFLPSPLMQHKLNTAQFPCFEPIPLSRDHLGGGVRWSTTRHRATRSSKYFDTQLSKTLG